MAEYKDKNGTLVSEGTKVTYGGQEFEIAYFKISMKGIYACGDVGCVYVNWCEKVEPPVEEKKTDEVDLHQMALQNKAKSIS